MDHDAHFCHWRTRGPINHLVPLPVKFFQLMAFTVVGLPTDSRNGNSSSSADDCICGSLCLFEGQECDYENISSERTAPSLWKAIVLELVIAYLP